MSKDNAGPDRGVRPHLVSWKLFASISFAVMLLFGTISNVTMNASAQNGSEGTGGERSITTSGEPLLPSNTSITRTFSYPTLKFEGDVVSELDVEITWNSDGTTDIKDNRGYELSLAIPRSQGNVSLFANSTVVDQRISGPELSYDIYWFPAQNADGYTDRYEFIAAGESRNANAFAIEVMKSEVLGSAIDSDSLAVGVVAESRDPIDSGNPVAAGNVDGLILDWSDAIASGVEARFDTTKSELNIPVNRNSRFFVDPYVVASISGSISPGKTLAFQDQIRLVTTYNATTARINAFYYDGSNIVYKKSDDEGDTWSSAVSLSTGTIASNNNRWSIATSSYNGTGYVHVFYWTKSGSTTTIKTIRGTVSDLNINWGAPVSISTISNNESCAPGACVSTTVTSDGNRTIFAAFIWNTTGGTFSLVIKRSTDNGANWSDSLSQINGIASNMLAMTLSPLEGPKILFAYAKHENANLYYRIFNGSNWGSEQTLSSNGMQSWTRKQLSSFCCDEDGIAYLAYTNVTLTSGGILKVAKFFGNGSYIGLETVDSTLRHYTPNISWMSNGDVNINSIANAKIYATRMSEGVWDTPFNPFGSTFDNPDELTATPVLNGENAAIWKEGTSAPYNLVFDMLEHGIVEPSTTIQLSPGYADYFEGERRTIETINRTQIAFYYDGSNIVYKTSTDLGQTWSSSSTSLGTGAIASDAYRWTVVSAFDNSTDRVVLLYFKTSGGSTTFYAKTFKIDNRVLTLADTASLFAVSNDASCSPTGVCAAASGGLNVNGTVFAAFSYKTGGNWYIRVMKSSDTGANWSNSLSATSISTSGARLPVTITNLDLGKMLLTWAKYDSSWMWYAVYNGSSWGATQSLSGIGWSSSTVKQISSDTMEGYSANVTMEAYVAYLSNGNHGDLKVARFAGNGTYLGTQTGDSTVDHWIPALSITNDDLVRVYSLSGGSIYETTKNMSSGWQSPVAVYAGMYYSPDQLTAQIAGPGTTGVLWRDGSTSPYSFKFAGAFTPTKVVKCPDRPGLFYKCDKYTTYYKKFYFTTPMHWTNLRFMWFFNTYYMPVANTDVFLGYPKTLTGSYTAYKVTAKGFATHAGSAVPVYGTGIGCSSHPVYANYCARTVSFYNVPRAGPAPAFDPERVWYDFYYDYRWGHATPKQFTIRLDLTDGYYDPLP